MAEALAAGVWWRPQARAGRGAIGVLRFSPDDKTVALLDKNDAVVLYSPAGDVGIRPLSNKQFELVAGGRAYRLNGMYAQAAAIPAVRQMARQQHAILMPPPGPGISADAYRRWITGSPAGLGTARNITPQRALWQEFWLRQLSEAGAQRLPSKRWERTYGQRDGPVRPEHRAHGRATTVASFVWVFVPLLTLGLFTWAAYLYAAIRVRRRWLWLVTLLIAVLNGLYYWLAFLDGSGQANSVGPAFAGVMLVVAVGGTWGAWSMRTYVFYGWRA